MDKLPERCGHGAVWRDCEDFVCREIWQLAEEQVKEICQQYALGYVAQRTAELKEKEKGDLGEQKTAEEIELDKQITKAWDDKDKGRTVSRNRSGLPYDHITIRAMHQFGAISERQARIAHMMLDYKGQSRPWNRIADNLGCSDKTVTREVNRINSVLSEKKRSSIDYPAGSILIVRTRGQRAVEYWLTQEIRFRNWRKTWRELITDPAEIRRLRREGRPVIYRRQIPYRQSPMNRLFGALIRELGQEFKDPSNRLPDGAEWPPIEFADDWGFNLQKARKLLSKRYPGGSWTTLQVYQALGRRSALCNGCRTPVLRGFRIGGHLVTQRAKYCDAACKMKSRRSAYGVKLAR